VSRGGAVGDEGGRITPPPQAAMRSGHTGVTPAPTGIRVNPTGVTSSPAGAGQNPGTKAGQNPDFEIQRFKE
jgi:hypothetical protein